MRRQEVYRLKRQELLWYLLGFVAVQVVLAIVIDRFWTRVRDPEYAFKEKLLRQRIAEAPRRPLVLALGSSRTLMALAPALLEPDGPLVFNFGMPGSGVMMEQTCLRRLLAAGVRPRAVLIETMPLYFTQGARCPLEEKQIDTARLTGSELARLWRYYDGLDWLLTRWCGARALPPYRYQAELRRVLGLDVPQAKYDLSNPYRGLDSLGWQPHCLEVTPQRREELTRFALNQYIDFAANFRLAPKPIRALEDLLDLCHKEHIPAMMLLPPEGSRFRALYAGEAERQIDAALRAVSAAKDVPLIDARQWVDDEGFWDSHHLLPVGAAQFTLRFQREVLRPLLERKPLRGVVD